MYNFEWLIPISLFVIIAAIFKMILDHKIRRQLIERGMVDENIKHLYPGQWDSNRLSSLKWGMVCIGIGIALLLGQLFPYNISDAMTVSFMFIFAGLGLLVFYGVVPKAKNSGPQQPIS